MPHDLGGFDDAFGHLITTRACVDDAHGPRLGDRAREGCHRPFERVLEHDCCALSDVRSRLQLGRGTRQRSAVMIAGDLGKQAQAHEE